MENFQNFRQGGDYLLEDNARKVLRKNARRSLSKDALVPDNLIILAAVAVAVTVSVFSDGKNLTTAETPLPISTDSIHKPFRSRSMKKFARLTPKTKTNKREMLRKKFGKSRKPKILALN